MQQPKAGHVNYGNLINDIEKGTIKIPQFQREFVWTKSQSAGLVDSILKGYPIGTFILWKTRERLRSVRNIGRISLPEIPDGDFVNYVLDGQQRMTSLYASLKGEKILREDGKEEDFSEIYINLTALEDEQIVVTSEEKEDGVYLKLTELLKMDLQMLFDNYQEHISKIQQYYKRIETYEFSTIIVEDVPIDIATEIFTRINVGGKDLTVFEIMCAKTYDYNKEFDLAEKYDELIKRLENVKYETISSSTVLQSVSICLVKECSKKNILKLNKNEFINSWDSIINSFEHAVDYIRLFYRIPVSQLLPYDGLLIPFTYFFYKNNNNKPIGNMEVYLQDYFWRCVLNSRFSGSLEAKVAQDIKKVVDKILNGEIPEYEEGINITEDNLMRSGWFSVGKAYIKGLLCILASKQPESFINGGLVTIDNAYLKAANSKNYHHFFPKAYLKKQGVDDAKINSIFNITIVDDFLNKRKIKDKAPSVYMNEFKKENLNLDKTMKTHLINDLNTFGIWTNDYDKFILERIKAMKSELESRIVIRKYDLY